MTGAYREDARVIEIGWATPEEARAGVDTMVDLLARRGVTVDPVTLMQLRAHADAYVEAEPDAAVFVGWGFAGVVNQRLEANGGVERLYREGESSTRWVLLSPAEAERRRARGAVLLDRPPRAGDARPLVHGLAVLVNLIVVAAALVATAAWWTLAFAAAALVLGTIAGVVARDAPATSPGRWSIEAAGLAAVGVPIAVLAWRGEVAWTIAIVGATLASVLLRRFLRPRPASAEDAGA